MTTWRIIKVGNFMGVFPRGYTEAITTPRFLEKEVAIPGLTADASASPQSVASCGPIREFKPQQPRDQIYINQHAEASDVRRPI